MKPFDITYCTGTNCPLKDNCIRYLIGQSFTTEVQKGEFRSWMEAPYIDELQGCLYYMPDKEEK